MRGLVSFACVISVLLFAVYAAPASTSLQVSAASGGGLLGSGGLAGILSNIDLPGLLQGVNSFVKLVGAFCPPLSQVLDNVIQNVTSTAFRVFGRAILRSGGLGGGSSGSLGGDSGQRVNVVLPTFPPDEDYDDEEEDSTISSTIASLSLDVEAVTSDAVTLYTSLAVEIDDSANSIARRHIRVVREAEDENSDQESAESAPEPENDLSDIDDQDRNKRYSPGGSDHGGAGAGSGNFLFDIIRLVAGSGATEESDEHEVGAGGIAEVDVQKSAEGYTEGIPGPITRLFVIANRGLANLVQDLILRLAQTSERLVNFKARLITALI
ncbi:uncharacterized protein LOC126744819 isoform X3 [Anthonomus grandis grandis]|uniref:uncharacterized protein LOC126744819 isoform X3 n=1 Tax=Anthonomus grandis grandis TaxID=2921223 RepID=UPI002166202F|nr:uncharacterized protein LOC126744819 isoform X3 [Anthonomus grandis grandis]